MDEGKEEGAGSVKRNLKSGGGQEKSLQKFLMRPGVTLGLGVGRDKMGGSNKGGDSEQMSHW